jgi:hypothetical protein
MDQHPASLEHRRRKCVSESIENARSAQLGLNDVRGSQTPCRPTARSHAGHANLQRHALSVHSDDRHAFRSGIAQGPRKGAKVLDVTSIDLRHQITAGETGLLRSRVHQNDPQPPCAASFDPPSKGQHERDDHSDNIVRSRSRADDRHALGECFAREPDRLFEQGSRGFWRQLGNAHESAERNGANYPRDSPSFEMHQCRAEPDTDVGDVQPETSGRGCMAQLMRQRKHRHPGEQHEYRAHATARARLLLLPIDTAAG